MVIQKHMIGMMAFLFFVCKRCLGKSLFCKNIYDIDLLLAKKDFHVLHYDIFK